MTELVSFSQAIVFAADASFFFDPAIFSEDLYWLEHNLLAFPSNLPEGTLESEIDRACRLGALLYLKAVLQEIPHSKHGSTLLLSQLRDALDNVLIQKFNSPLLLWLSLIGGSLSKAEMRAWFVEYLAQIRSTALVLSFDDLEGDLSRLLGLKKVFGKAYETLWDETLLKSGTFFASPTVS